jgi:hypothetical protein
LEAGVTGGATSSFWRLSIMGAEEGSVTGEAVLFSKTRAAPRDAGFNVNRLTGFSSWTGFRVDFGLGFTVRDLRVGVADGVDSPRGI